MKISETSVPEVLLIEPAVYSDPRGSFMETYHRARYHEAGITAEFVQDNLSFSVRGTLRGLHYQFPQEQAKLLQVIQGEIFDVALDIRRGSAAFGQWTGVRLSGEERRQLFVPAGFAHGFCVVSETALVAYRCSDLYAPACEGGVLWSDPALGIEWPVREPLLSEKDARFPHLHDISPERLPQVVSSPTQSSKKIET